MIADPQLNPAAIELGIFFPHPLDTVWRALTEPDLLGQWLLRPTGFSATAGTRFGFTIPDASVDEVECEVLIARHCDRLTYSWTYPQSTYPTPWIIDWTLRPQGLGTRLLLTQTGFDLEDRQQKMARNAMERTWKRRLLPRLGEVLDH
ncbi:SRPBCC domain-containing protein [Nocardia sp. NPDC050406]|uniref:SRPBCC domain-containing protein n=1 Tax=Nocardia sp. NPDC050406 TaxID=3364318 RepID=UPI0037ADB9A2